MKKVLFVQGSLRKQSFNRQVQAAILEELGDSVEVSELDYSELPLINQDIEWPTPDAVAKVREQFMAAGAVWVVTPQYNASFPGHVKNLFDWMSRPVEQGKPDTAIRGKKVTVTGIGGRSATAQMRAALSSLLRFIGMETMDEDGTGYAVNGSAWMSNVVELDDKQIEALQKQVSDFKAFIEA